ncbi:hypothetical protein FSP39_008093 [Pinctada imbricata]|uniref:Uncharacterized protein n=1 Tax=Pinctada imbricata TaxID=66713 RepID=A0AA89C0V8_PINIB|nr:hypothetical protein FSP39_008093 [Pinctada imbricata]
MTMVIRVFAFLGFVGLISAQCTPQNCKLPLCRCYGDGTVPGGLATNVTPQIVLITLGFEIDSEYRDLYKSLFTVRNPNGCPITGTIFVQDSGSDFGMVKDFYDSKFEIGIQSDLIKPTDQKGWDDTVKKVYDHLTLAGIKDTDIRGLRAGQLNPGGQMEFISLGNEKMLYSMDCVSTSGSYGWPYTFDIPDTRNVCTTGTMPLSSFPGKWGVPISALSFKNTTCATAAGCVQVVQTKQDAFDLFYNNFLLHYNGNKGPYVVEIDPQWAKNQDYLDGTIQFIEYVRAAHDDVWMITAWQAIQWTQTPVPLANLSDFQPWKCT